MPFTFANPLGFWALLSIPAIILIHFLQQRSRVLKISTHFLLDHLQLQSVKGNKFDRLRSSVPLYLQILAALILTWILVQPRWLKQNTIQRIAIVLDSSASMQAFRNNITRDLKPELERLSHHIQHSEYVVIDSQLSKKSLFNGTDINLLMQAINQWQPRSTAHDFNPALRVARSLVGPDGLVIMLSDHLIEDLAYQAQLLAVGQKTANVGFAGLRIETRDDGQILWKALVRNYSDQNQQRNWFLHTKSQKSKARALKLEPGQTRSLQGAFPESAETLTLHLDADAFTIDDQLPIILPQKKQLTLSSSLAENLQEKLKPVITSLQQVSSPNPEEPPDLTLSEYDPLQPRPLTAGSGIVFIKHSTLPSNYLKGQILAEPHPLTEGLNWQSLLARSSTGIPLQETDSPLLWQKDRVLIFLRSKENESKLIFNFDLASSNASRLPAFLITIHRFVESIRSKKIALSQNNFEIGQNIDLAYDHSNGASALKLIIQSGQETTNQEPRSDFPQSFRAPEQTVFFDILQGNKTVLLKGATHFADTREADLQQAASRNDLKKSDTALVEQHSQQDTRWQLWMLLLCLCLLVSWHFITRSTNSRAT